MNLKDTIVFLISFVHIHTVLGKCYFPGELQGVWATQAAPDVLDAPIGYTMVKIDANEISTWGQCYSKVDNNIILVDRSGCFRCFRLVVASVNVAALVSGGLETCSSSVEGALNACPTTERGAAHIVLYKVRSSWGDSGLQETQCPFSGIYFFSFEKGERGFRGRRRRRCEQPTSEMTNCPFGFSLSLQYRDCTFEEPRAASWHCLGSWQGLDGQMYTAVLDMYSKEGDGMPKYKCGIYREDKATKRIFLSFSRDSTCTNGLESAEDGHERYVLHSASSSPLPSSVRDRTCRFPSSLRGQWHNTDIGKSSISYRDERSFETLHLQCVREFGDSERYAVYTRSDCGKWFYTCVLLKRRSSNVMELMFGEMKSESLRPDLCNIEQFGNMSVWITQARTNLEVPTSCPIVGTYKGELPDSPGYCAQLFSECTRTDVMYYAVDECNNPNAIFERKNFSKPRKVPASVFVPPTRLDDFHKTEAPPSAFNRRVPAIQHSPREIQVGVINSRAPGRRIPFERPFESSVKGASLIITRKKREPPAPEAYYRAGSPKTTTISFIWGQSTSTPTPNTPFLNVSRPSRPFFGERQGGHGPSHAHDHFIGNNPTFFNERQPNLGAGVHRDSFQPRQRNSHAQNQFQENRGHTNRQFRLFPQQTQNIPVRNSAFDNFEGNTRGTQVQPFNKDPIRPPPPRVIPSATTFRRVSPPQDRRNSGVRPLPVGERARGPNPTGFWPNNRPEPNRPIPHSITVNKPWPSLVTERPLGVTSGTWHGPPSPSPSLRDISFESTPSPFRFSNFDDSKVKYKSKKEPHVEEREYQCIGDWEENGRVYALTRRRDIHTYECFVGVINSQGVVYMKEAGSSCKRGIRPDDFGMRTVMKEECVQESSRSNVRETASETKDGWRGSRWASRNKETSPTPPPWIPSTKRPWKPITGRPRRQSNGTLTLTGSRILISVMLLYFTYIYL